MNSIAHAITGGLDLFRARLLHWTTQSSDLKRLFVSRWKRLALAFVLATIVQLGLAVRFPIAVLVIGPMILGGPHLIASLRHGLGSAPSQLFAHHRSRIWVSTTIWFAIAGLRLMNRAPSGHWPEIGGMLALALIWLPLVRSQTRSCALLILAIGALAGGTTFFPHISFAFLILFHHFVAFFHWIKAAQTRAESRVAWSALALFTVVHGWIFLGAFDAWIQYSEWTSMPIEALESSFFGWTQDPRRLAQCLVAYAFGQSIHYTLWLKFIPEQQHGAQVPTSFRQSWRLLIQDLSPAGMRWATLFVLVLIALATSVSAYQFRWIYFCVASLHGFYEIFGLFLKLERTA